MPHGGDHTAALLGLARRALAGASADVLFEDACAMVQAALGATGVVVLALRRDPRRLELQAAAGLDHPASAPHADGEGWWVPAGRGTPAGQALTVDGPVVAAARTDDPRFTEPYPWAASTELEASLAVVIRKGPRPYGVLEVLAPLGRKFAQHEIAFLQGAAQLLAESVHRSVAEDALERLRRRNDQLLRSLHEGVVGLDEHGVVTFANTAMAGILGWEPELLIGRRLHDLVHPRHADGTRFPLDDCPIARTHAEAVQRSIRGDVFWHRDGSAVSVDYHAAPLWEGDRTSGAVVTIRDVSDLAEAEQRFRLAFEHAPIGIALVGTEGRYLRVNESLCAIVGYTEEELLARTFQEITHPDDLEAVLAQVRQTLAGETRGYEMDKRYIRADGSLMWVRLSVALARDARGDPLYFISHVEDITERRLLQDALEHRAFHDALTGLPNRELLLDRLRQALRSAARTGAKIALFFCDVDHFKRINDTYGHAAGDRVLQHVAAGLRAAVREGDTAGRLAGDEFVVICEGLATAADVGACAERIRSEVERPVYAAGAEIPVTLSMGVALIAPGVTAEDALARADEALYRAKRRGRARWELLEATSQG